MASSSVSSGMKLMRRGTRSCQECRRRKIKCTYAAAKSVVCNECSTNGRLCTSQGILPQSKTAAGVEKSAVNVRIARLESVVERLSKTPPDQLTKFLPDSYSETQLQFSMSSANTKRLANDLEHQASKGPPLFTLFSNEVIQTGEDLALPPSIYHSIDFGLAQMSDREKLLSTISKETGILDVLNIAGSWWLPWQFFYPGMREMDIAESLQDFVTVNLGQSKPVLVATGLLCVAMSLQSIRPGIDDQILQLSTSTTELMNRITAAIDQVVLDNDDYILCFEGVLLVLMRGKHHAESNQLRKAWAAIRRSILLAQKIGLTQQPSERRSALAIQCQQFVESMFETDRFLSMFLGMPYALEKRFDHSHVGDILSTNVNADEMMRALRRITAIAAGRINDRNSGPEESAFKITTKIQSDLKTAAESMPTNWWNISTHATHVKNPSLAHEHLHAQFWFYQIECHLHLPYMLRAASDESFEYNRQLCLNSSRELVKVWITLRQNAVLSVYTCRLDDFQGLMSVIVLLVGLLQYYSQELKPQGFTIEDDLSLIDRAKGVFRFAAQQQSGTIAKQGLRVIETLSSFLKRDNIAGYSSAQRTATLFIPYFGAIEIESGPLHYPKMVSSINQSQQQHLNPSFNGSRNSNNGVTSDDSFDTFLIKSSPDYQRDFWSSDSRGQYSNIPTNLTLEGNDSNIDIYSTLREIQPASPEVPSSSVDQLGHDAEILDPELGTFNAFPADLMLDWDKVMMEADLNQDWDAALVEFV